MLDSMGSDNLYLEYKVVAVYSIRNIAIAIHVIADIRQALGR